MKVNDWLRLIAGVFVLLSVVLGATVHPAWNYAAAFVCGELDPVRLHRLVPDDGVVAGCPGSRLACSALRDTSAREQDG